MSKISTIERLNRIIEEVLDLESLIITHEMTAEDVEGWDSLSHVRIIIAAEEEFSIRFSTHEVAELKSIGDIVQLIDRKI